MVSTIDTHNPEVIADWKDTGSMISSGVGAVGGAALGGGNVGATAAGGLAGNIIYKYAFPDGHPLGKDKNPLDTQKTNQNTG